MLDNEFSNGETTMRHGGPDQIAAGVSRAVDVIRGRFGCGSDEAERLLSDTAEGARMDLAELADRLLEPGTRQAALAAVAVVLRNHRDGIV